MLPGRKPKPPALRVLEGNPGKRPIRQGVKAPPTAPKQPRWARHFPPPRIPEPIGQVEVQAQGQVEGQDDPLVAARVAARETEIAEAEQLAAEAKELQRDAAAEWRRVVPELDRLGLLAVVDGALLTDYCVCWARLLLCERTLTREGMSVRGERGIQKHPCLTAATALRAALRGYIAELGLGPSSRGRLALPGVDDGGDELLD